MSAVHAGLVRSGLGLIAVGVVAIFFVVNFGSSPTTVTYLAVVFGFLVTLAGIALLFSVLFVELKSKNDPDSSLEIADSSDIENAVRQLGKNYDILRGQATQGFVLAGIFMAMGILVILAGSLGEMFGFKEIASNLTTVAGVTVEAVSALGLYLFKETSKRLNSTSDRLHEMWRILAAFKKAETLPDTEKSEVIISLIKKLAEVPVVIPAT